MLLLPINWLAFSVHASYGVTFGTNPGAPENGLMGPTYHAFRTQIKFFYGIFVWTPTSRHAWNAIVQIQVVSFTSAFQECHRFFGVKGSTYTWEGKAVCVFPGLSLNLLLGLSTSCLSQIPGMPVTSSYKGPRYNKLILPLGFCWQRVLQYKQIPIPNTIFCWLTLKRSPANKSCFSWKFFQLSIWVYKKYINTDDFPTQLFRPFYYNGYHVRGVVWSSKSPRFSHRSSEKIEGGCMIEPSMHPRKRTFETQKWRFGMVWFMLGWFSGSMLVLGGVIGYFHQNPTNTYEHQVKLGWSSSTARLFPFRSHRHCEVFFWIPLNQLQQNTYKYPTNNKVVVSTQIKNF